MRSTNISSRNELRGPDAESSFVEMVAIIPLWHLHTPRAASNVSLGHMLQTWREGISSFQSC